MITLSIACMYIIYDTQLIIERAEKGDRDVPTDTMTLFFDLFDLFIKILRVLQEMESNKKKRRDDD